MDHIDPDTKEKMENYVAMSAMFVKILMASFPMLFVPQQCGDDPCTMGEKFGAWNWLFLVNFLTFGTFGGLYYVQAKRESFMITNFDEDDDKAENHLTEQIVKYPDIHSKIVSLNTGIRKCNYACMGMYAVNTVYSSLFILLWRYLDSTTLTVLITNSLLVQGKLMQIHASYTGDDLAMSTVGTRPKVFNVIDKDVPAPDTAAADDVVIEELAVE
uniref:Uncharacterized protein n=1 Tax=viral metagenome TaxID=1070528 RepID=A0A6C0KCK7_9ZZZZ